MTKRAFLDTLERRLAMLTPAEREEYLSYYAELIEDMLEEGLSEQEAVSRLEDIDTIVGRIWGERGMAAPVEPAKYKGGGCLRTFLIAAVTLVIVTLVLSYAGVTVVGKFFDGLQRDAAPEMAQGPEIVINEDGSVTEGEQGTTEEKKNVTEKVWNTDEEKTDVVYEHLLGEIPADGIRGIDIDWASDAVWVEPWDGETIRIAEAAETPLEEVHYGMLSVKGSEAEIDFSARKGRQGYPEKRLIVCLPKTFYLEHLSVDSASGEIIIHGVKGREAEIDTASGSVTIEGFAEVDIDSASGAVRLAGDWQQAEIDTASGAVYVALPEESGYTLRFETASGAFYSNGHDRTQKKMTHIEGDGSRLIEVSTASGSLHIDTEAAK